VLLAATRATALHPAAIDDQYRVQAGATLAADAAHGVLANDGGAPLTIARHTQPSYGTLTFNRDGSFTYTPFSGYAGADGFTYTITDAVRVYRTTVPPLATIGGTRITGGGYGSSLAPVPGTDDRFYGLADCGPRVGGPNGTKVDPIPNFQPAVGVFRLIGDEAVLERRVPLSDASGAPYSGRNNAQNPVGDTFVDLGGIALPLDPNGYDSEGLVALADGTFWVSDEYGPFITHFDADGRQLERLSPFDGTLPGELAKRTDNRGLEGLCVTPDGSTLVAIMQSALEQNDLHGARAKKVALVRIVTYALRDGELHEYPYLLDNPNATGTMVSEIAALSNTTFLVDERDSQFPPGSYKKLFRIDLDGATDIGPSAAVGTYRSGTGLEIAGHTLEGLIAGMSTSAAAAALAGAGITPVSKTLHLDVGALLDALDPHGGLFAHDKFEGVAVLDGGTRLVISNDSDFGIGGVSNAAPPYRFTPKLVPATGAPDDGELLVIDLRRLPVATSTANVAITVAAAPCVGDCDGDGQVRIDELVRGIRIALGVTALDECPSLDCDDTHRVPIDCLIRAANGALVGCAVH
jgi:hypothetical protein